ncbi:MAG: acetyl-CoA C-acetyltransferase [Candidatus Berkiella sp.]
MSHRKSRDHDKVVYVVDGARTPFLKMKGVPGPFSAADLGTQAAKALLAKQPFAPDAFDEVIVGCAGPSEEEANIARIIALRSGCGKKMSAYTVQRNCASGLQAIDNAVQSIQLGRSQLVLAGGAEAMSRAPLLYNKAMVFWLANLGRAKSPSQKLHSILKFRPKFLVPVIGLLKGLTDPVVNMNMGQTAEELAYLFHITRLQMDEYAANSHLRALAAFEEGLLGEIAPLYATDGTVYEQDDGVRTDSTVERLAKLKPVFDKHGSITAGNSSQISDGAAFVVLASEEAVDKYQLPVIAKVVDTHFAALDPTIMGLGPVHAMTPILARNNLALDDIDHMEINEAFAAQVIGCVRAWQDDKYCKEALGLKAAMGSVDMAKLNPEGGAIAIGHPVGASGARLVLHCANMLEKHKTKRALASLCIGGGQGGAILLERVGA